MKKSVPDWEYLPDLCLLMILQKLNVPRSQVQFGAVSRHWHSMFKIFLDIKRASSPNPIPMLLIPSKKSETKRKLYSLRAQAIVSSIELPKPYPIKFCGSCYGWLATVQENMVITLSNPFNGISIDLPQLDYYDTAPIDYRYKIRKVVLSADPSLHPDNYFVAVIYSVYCKFAIYKSSEKIWIYFKKDRAFLTDVIFYRSLVYVIGHHNDVLSFDVLSHGSFDENSEPKLKSVVAADGRPIAYCDRVYLVESSNGSLYSIHRDLNLDYVTEKIKVFKIVLDDENGELLEKTEVKSMDGDVVFVGDNGTLAVSALDFPQGQPNSIYFTDDYTDTGPYGPLGPRDVGIFNLKDGSLEQHYPFKPSHKHLPPYTWILPPVQFRPILRP